jgi:dimethylargininase
MLALTHLPSPRMSECELTHVERTPIDHDLALAQHGAYCDTLRRWGLEVRVLEVNADHPDCAFIEDVAIILDEVAILTSLGTPSRRGERDAIEPVLGRYREVRRIELPARIEGGDVLQVNRTLFVGLSSRTDEAGISALLDIVKPLGYRVIAVPVRGCLHLKTACTAVADDLLLINPEWVDEQPLKDFACLRVPEGEPWGANVLRIGGRVCLSSEHVETAEMIRRRGIEVVPVDISEFAKAEAGVTCLSLLVR